MIRYWLWNRGEFFIVLSAFMATASLLMNWTHFWIFEKSGFALGYLITLTAWIYPLRCILSDQRMVTWLGKICAAVSIAFALIFLYIASHASILFIEFNVVATGGVVFLLASLLFYAGVAIDSKCALVNRDSERAAMGVVGHFLWFILGGIGVLMGLIWWLVGLIAFVSIIGISWGKACFAISKFSFLRFGRKAFSPKELHLSDTIGSGTLFDDSNFIWLVFAGIWLALGHVILALVCILTIVGIPFGIQHLKLAGIALVPAGIALVPIGETAVGEKATSSSQLCNPCAGEERISNIMGRGRGLYSFCADSKQMHVITRPYHAIGQARFILEPDIGLGKNCGLAPWAVSEAEYLVRHHKKEIRDTWKNHFRDTSVVTSDLGEEKPQPQTEKSSDVEEQLSNLKTSEPDNHPAMSTTPSAKTRICFNCRVEKPLKDFLSKHVYVNSCRKCRLLKASTISV